MTKDTQEVVKPEEGQTPTPTVETPKNPEVAEELRRELESFKKQLADKDKFITDLKSEKETLEARFTQVNRQPTQTQPVDNDLQKEAARILEVAQIDPAKAGEELGNLIKNTTSKVQQETLRNLEPIITQTTYINEVKKANADLIDLGLEPGITLKANQLMQAGKTFKEAVDTAISEARSKVDKLKSVSVPTPPPASAVVESGANKQPEPPKAPVEESDLDEIKKEQERKRKLGL